MVEHLLQPSLVGAQQRQIVRDVRGQGDFGGLCGGVDLADAVPHQAGHVDPVRGEVEAAGLDARDVEDDVDQPQQLAPGFVDLAGELGHRAPDGLAGLAQQRIGEADHGVERRAQLVAHGGEETRLRLVGRFRRFLGAPQLLLRALVPRSRR